ncbi:hypothetical protein [Microbacterium saperdae]|uniref:Uncharacterized protein n=1 Tax=Microbacterium saperdae TaxID=69368 RepID=A0A543BQV8_9MICO|nr:hypothetical protein [Microbacterium saperdae]TQL87188.1 hypothetical protein FB560_2855 [Microbacterium saperdae]GGM42238.1 hypothetical protein GCM10010489_11620 [Microbacterium saperdae]
MELESAVAVTWIVSILVWALAAFVALFLSYLVIRLGVFHGLRAHTRWVDEGKDRHQDTVEPYRLREDHRR